MKRSLAVLSGVLVGLAACGKSATGPATEIIQNDSYTTGTPTFVGGFGPGDAGAVVLGPETNAFTLRKVKFFFGGGGTSQTITLTIYADVGTDAPGAALHSADYVLTPSSAAMQEIDVTAQHLVVDAGQKIRVAIFFHHSGMPSIAADGNGAATSGKNYIYGSAWDKVEVYGVHDNWIIRAEIEKN